MLKLTLDFDWPVWKIQIILFVFIFKRTKLQILMLLACSFGIIGSSSKDLPSIYLQFTFKSIIFGLLLNKIYLHFTFNLPSIYIQFTFVLPSLTFSLPSTLPSTYLQFTFNLPSKFGWNIFAWNSKYFCVVKISKAKKANVNKR